MSKPRVEIDPRPPREVAARTKRVFIKTLNSMHKAVLEEGENVTNHEVMLVISNLLAVLCVEAEKQEKKEGFATQLFEVFEEMSSEIFRTHYTQFQLKKRAH